MVNSRRRQSEFMRDETTPERAVASSSSSAIIDAEKDSDRAIDGDGAARESYSSEGAAVTDDAVETRRVGIVSVGAGPLGG